MDIAACRKDITGNRVINDDHRARVTMAKRMDYVTISLLKSMKTIHKY